MDILVRRGEGGNCHAAVGEWEESCENENNAKRLVKILIRNIIVLIAAAMVIVACEDHDSWADNYVTNFADVITDYRGEPTTMRLDDGRQFYITSIRADVVSLLGGKASTLTPDSAYRCVCIYTCSDSTARIANLAPAFAPKPVADSVLMSITHNIKTDPCRIEGIWRAGEYINARMLVEGHTLSHTAAFVDRGITQKADGSRILHLLLYHDNNGDPEAFTRTIYLSCPLMDYRNILTHSRDVLAHPRETLTNSRDVPAHPQASSQYPQDVPAHPHASSQYPRDILAHPRDSIYFYVNQYDVGLTTFKFPY